MSNQEKATPADLFSNIEQFFDNLLEHTDPENKDALVGLKAQVHAVSGSAAPAESEKSGEAEKTSEEKTEEAA